MGEELIPLPTETRDMTTQNEEDTIELIVQESMIFQITTNML
jgi:hypothetical protein